MGKHTTAFGGWLFVFVIFRAFTNDARACSLRWLYIDDVRDSGGSKDSIIFPIQTQQSVFKTERIFIAFFN